jgi:hypothetical protein
MEDVDQHNFVAHTHTHELYRPSDRRLSAKLVPTFADRGYHVVSVADPYGRIVVL